jgi:hypothetical protein
MRGDGESGDIHKYFQGFRDAGRATRSCVGDYRLICCSVIGNWADRSDSGVIALIIAAE